MINVRHASERGRTQIDWLDSYHTFSFNTYYDPRHTQFRSLRVINEDVVNPGAGFGMHPHQDMEILTWVLDGGLEHRDNTGGGGVIRRGDLQHMTAGTGIYHSEFNASKSEPVHLLQIWLRPSEKGLKPGYEQTHFDAPEFAGKFRVLAAPEPREGALQIHQDAELHVAALNADAEATYPLRDGRHAWLQVARGAVKVNGVNLEAGDGAAVSEEKQLRVEAVEPAEVLLFDLA
jgi:quercetin 2,3-dioxygenase